MVSIVERLGFETQPSEKLKLSSNSESIQSVKHSNEDSSFSNDRSKVYGVFDGVGGRAGGDVASKKVSMWVSGMLEQIPATLDVDKTTSYVAETIYFANRKLIESQRMNPHLGNMATTASVVKVWEGPGNSKKAIMANVGDSRVYTYRKGQLVMQSFDDGVVRENYGNDATKAYQIQEYLDNCDGMPPSDYPELQYLYMNRNRLSTAVGREDMKVRVRTFDVQKGDLILITSDGVHDNLTKKQIEKISSKYDPAILSKALCRLAFTDKGKRHKDDDITAVVVRIG